MTCSSNESCGGKKRSRSAANLAQRSERTSCDCLPGGFGPKRKRGRLRIPMDIVQRFKVPGVPIEGIRRELLVGSAVEERNVGHFLAEKTAGVFYFPHTSFTEFLVADYIMSSDFLNIDVAKLSSALYGEVPTFLTEHPSRNAISAVYDRMKAAQTAMTTPCMTVLLNDFSTRMNIELVTAKSTEPWDICLHYFFLHAQHSATRAKEFAEQCLGSDDPGPKWRRCFV